MNALLAIQAAVEETKAAGAYPLDVGIVDGKLVTQIKGHGDFIIRPYLVDGADVNDVCSKADVEKYVGMEITFGGLTAKGTIGVLESMPKIAEDSPRDYPNRAEMKRRAAEGMETLMRRLLKVEERGLA